VQPKPRVEAVAAAAAWAKPVAAALETPVSSADVATNASQVPQVPQVSGQRGQQVKAQGGTTSSATPSQDVSSASAATAVSEAPSVKSSVVASSGAAKQTAGSATLSAGVSGGDFSSVAAQVAANAGAAPVAAAPSDQAAAAANQTDSSPVGQIARAVSSAGPDGAGHQMVIQLTPPELGRVRLTLESRGDQIRGVLRVDDPGTLWQFRQESPALLHRLSESGLDVRQMDILPSQQGSGQSQPFSQQQDGQAARQQQSSPWRDAASSAAPRATFSQATPVEDVQYVGTGSINTLV